MIPSNRYYLRTNANKQAVIDTLRGFLNNIDNSTNKPRDVNNILEYTHKNLSLICRCSPPASSKRLIKTINAKMADLTTQLEKVSNSSTKTRLRMNIKRLRRTCLKYL